MNDTKMLTDPPVSTVDLQAFRWSQPLVVRYAHDFASVRTLFGGNTAVSSDWALALDRIRKVRSRPPDIVPILLRQLEERSAPTQARASAETLAVSGAVAIVTGQQAGLFGGPLYTLLKAVSAISLARWVQAQFEVPAVPIFWVESEDHDWDEVRSAAFLDATFTAKVATAIDPAGARRHPVGRLRFADDDSSLDGLRRELPQTEFTEDLLGRLGRHYRSGARVGTAFAGWLDDILGPHGLVVYEADDQRAKPLVADIFARELTDPGRTARSVRQQAASFRAMGFEPHLEPAEDAVALFYLDEEGRRPVRQEHGLLAIGSKRLTAIEAAAEASQHPERFSPNVILRPIVQDRLFPTVCYVGGPSEFVYQSQIRQVYSAFGVEPPLLHPRLSATLSDAGTAKFLRRYGLAAPDLHDTSDNLLRRLVERELPAGLEAMFSDVQAQLAAQTERLRPSVTQVDHTLDGAVDTTLTRLQDTVATLQSKVIQAAKKKDETLRRQLVRAQTLVCPDGVPQERALSALYFLNRHGPALCDRLLELDPRSASQHYVLHL